MKQTTIQKIRIMQIVLLIGVAVLLFCGGCGKQDDDPGEEAEGLWNPTLGTARNRSGAEEGSEKGLGEYSEEELAGKMISHERLEVAYDGNPFVSSIRAIGGNSIYLAGYYGEPTETMPDDSYFIGRIGIGESEVQEFALELPADLFVYRSCVDGEGRWHLLLGQRIDNRLTYERTEIWVVNSGGEVEQTIDITEVMQGKNSMPYWLAVDEAGNYYMDDSREQPCIWMISSRGELVQQLACDRMQGLGVGKSGAVYGVFEDEDGRVCVMSYEEENYRFYYVPVEE